MQLMLLVAEMFLFQIEKNKKSESAIQNNAEIIRKLDEIFDDKNLSSVKRQKAYEFVKEMSRKNYGTFYQSKDMRVKLKLEYLRETDFFTHKHLMPVSPTVSIYLDNRRAGDISIYGINSFTINIPEKYYGQVVKRLEGDACAPKVILETITDMERIGKQETPEERAFNQKWEELISSDYRKSIYNNFRIQALYATASAFGLKMADPAVQMEVQDGRELDKKVFGDKPSLIYVGGLYEGDKIIIARGGYAWFMNNLSHEFCHALSQKGRMWHGWEDKTELPHWIVEGATELAATKLRKTIASEGNITFGTWGGGPYTRCLAVVQFIAKSVGEKIFWNSFFVSGDFEGIASKFCEKKGIAPSEFIAILRNNDTDKVLARLEEIPDRKN